MIATKTHQRKWNSLFPKKIPCSREKIPRSFGPSELARNTWEFEEDQARPPRARPLVMRPETPYRRCSGTLRPLHEPPQFGERALLLEPVQDGEEFHRRRLVDGALGAGEELLLDLLLGERDLRGAACVITHALDGAAVGERHRHARRAVLGDVGEFRVDQDRE